MDVRELATIMPTFGFEFLGLKRGTGIPSFAAWMVTSCHPEDGRRDRTVRLDAPDHIALANADWFALASEFGLFSSNQQFLLSLEIADGDKLAGDEPGERVWGLVELHDDWDVMGAGAAAHVLGWGFGCPGFAMSAIDGSVFVQGTVWQGSIGTAILPLPWRVESLREIVRRNIGKPYRTEAENVDASIWLARAENCAG